jgi:hypothetical protein
MVSQVPDQKDQPGIVFRLGQLKIPVEQLIRKNILIQLIAILVLDLQQKPAAGLIVIYDIEHALSLADRDILHFGGAGTVAAS